MRFSMSARSNPVRLNFMKAFSPPCVRDMRGENALSSF